MSRPQSKQGHRTSLVCFGSRQRCTLPRSEPGNLCHTILLSAFSARLKRSWYCSERMSSTVYIRATGLLARYFRHATRQFAAAASNGSTTNEVEHGSRRSRPARDSKELAERKLRPRSGLKHDSRTRRAARDGDEIAARKLQTRSGTQNGLRRSRPTGEDIAAGKLQTRSGSQHDSRTSRPARDDEEIAERKLRRRSGSHQDCLQRRQHADRQYHGSVQLVADLNVTMPRRSGSYWQMRRLHDYYRTHAYTLQQCTS